MISDKWSVIYPFRAMADNNYLCLARQFSREGKISLAQQNYFLYFYNTPQSLWDTGITEEFVSLVCDMKIFIRLEASITKELWKTMTESINLFPNNTRLWELAADIYHLFEIQKEFAKTSFTGFEIAEKNNISCVAIERKMLDVMWYEVPRWHFRMLNGKLRNTAYKTAIHKALDEGYTTSADIGAGCGLLSLYLASHHSKPTITLFESNKTFYDLAITNLKVQSPDIIIDSYQSNSNDVILTKFKSNLLVTEIFDVAVFGEGIISTIIHSLKQHIDHSNFRIIPAKVNVFVTGVRCDSLNRQYRVQKRIPCLNIDEYIHITKDMEDNPYDAENLLEHNFEVLTDTTEVIELHFNEREMLEFVYQNKWSKTISLHGIRDGHVDCLVVWFDLHLDNEVMISTNPFHKKNEPCWEQAVFHCPIPLKIVKNAEQPLFVKIINEHLLFDSMNEKVQVIPHYTLKELCIQFLNDEKWTEFLISLSDKLHQLKQLTVLDFSSFPLLALLLAKRGFNVIHVSQSEDFNYQLVYHLMRKNEIDLSLFSIFDMSNFAPHVLSQEKIDYVFYEPFDSGGRLKQSPLDNIIFRKFDAKSFFSNIIVNFKLIHSPYLDYCNKVSEENVEPFKHLADNINVFTGTEHPCLPNNFPHESMTNEQQWNIEDASKVLTLEILKNGKINGILTWFTLVGIGDVQFCTKESTYCNLNALLLQEREVEQNEIIAVFCRYEKGGFFKIEICDKKQNSTKNTSSPSIKKFYSVYRNKYL